MNKLFAAAAVFTLLAMSYNSNAQTKATIEVATEQATSLLESEYIKELDKWMLQAYEGDREAQFKVGVLFTNDQFKSSDLGQSVYWYKQAARQGHAPAQYNLGHQYLTGSGVKRNEAEAMKWWLKAAEQDHPLAQFNVGRAYYLGIGLKEDHAQSRLWFKRAAKNNEPKSIDILQQLNWAEPGEFKDASDIAKTQTDTAIPDVSGANSLARLAVTSGADDTNTLAPQASVSQALQAESAPTQNLAGLNQTKQAATIETATNDGTESSAASTVAAKEPAIKDKSSVEPTKPIAVYTNPAKRAVLIAILNDRRTLDVISRDGEWTKVTSKTGFPVWVHRDYIVVSDDIGSIQGNAVNARSVPLITNGTIVGRLNDNDTLAVISKKNAWYRVVSPSHFNAWVKTDELYRKEAYISKNNEPDSRASESQDVSSEPEQQLSNASATKSKHSINDNDWLFMQPADGYTLQLASFDDPQKVAEFQSRSKFVGNPLLHSFTSRSKNVEWTYFLYGAFGSSETAKQTRIKIKQKLAWVRSFGKLQQNRCVAWKKQLPPPKELNKYCS